MNTQIYYRVCIVYDLTEDPTTGVLRPDQLTEDPTTGTISLPTLGVHVSSYQLSHILTD